MKISYSWLKDYMDIKIKPEELAHKLTMAGLEVVGIENKGNDIIFELEVTPNRPDCLSLIGIAREVGAITGKKVLSLKPKALSKNLQLKAYSLGLKIEDKNDCSLYSGRVIKGVKIAPSPKWLQDRLISVGLRPVNNIVDITNFVLMETGQPLHAFDADKLEEVVTVRRAQKGETITTIDGLKRDLNENILIIADKKKPLALAGIMGGLETEVNQNTKNIFLESAYFNPIVVRKGARQLGLSSESSYRFERGVDLGGIINASNRAAELIIQLAGGESSKIYSAGTKKVTPQTITLSPKKLNSVLGLGLSSSAIKKILESLELKVSSKGKDSFKVKVPSFRRDLSQEIDLIEEVSRMAGYDNIPLTIPKQTGGFKELLLVKEDKWKKVEQLTRATLAGLGLNEIITYSLISRDLLAKLDLKSNQVISISNPLSREQEIMRPSLIPNLVNTVSRNISYKNNHLKLFELGKVYFYNQNKNHQEKIYLSLGLTGQGPSDWQNKPKNFDFFNLKGAVNTLLENLGIKNINWPRQILPYFHQGESQNIETDGIVIGVLGRISDKILGNFDIKTNLYIAELNFEEILKKANLNKHFSPLPKYPSVNRDLSLIAEKDIPVQDIENLIKKVGYNLITNIKLTDIYFGQPIPQGQKGLLYSIDYQTPQRTLTDQEVNQLHQNIIEALIQEFKIKIR